MQGIFYSKRGDCERVKRKLQQMCCRVYPFILMDNNKGRNEIFFGGCSPHWVNHVYLCLYCIVYILCFILLLYDPVFLT
jgi:hypothetical protein